MTFILYLIYAILIIGPIYLIWAIFRINDRTKKIEWLSSQEYTILRIDVPRNNDKAPLAAEQMFAAIHGIYSESASFQNHLSFEIVARENFIQFYVYLPTHLKDFIEGQIYAQYPTVEIQEVDDYILNTPINEHNFAIADLLMTKPDVYPIKQFTDFEVDPISGITAVMTKLNPGEEVWFQVVIKPVGDDWQERGHSMVSAVRSGAKFGGKGTGRRILQGLGNFLKAIFIQAVTPGADMTVSESEVKLPASVEEALKNIEQKITKLGYETKIRIMTLGNDAVSTRMKCTSVAAAFKQYNTTNLNGFKVGAISLNDHTQWKDFAHRSFEDNGNIFNISELASIFHFPHSSVSTPNIVWSGSKKGEPPANLPILDNTPNEDLTIIGETNFRNVFKEFGIKRDDRRRHIYIVGKSGVGKSVLIENMTVNDVLMGRGVIVVDPHGELADKVLACIPENRIEDVVVFDPSDREFPIAFNLLEQVNDDFKGIVASGFVGIFKKIFGDSWGPRLEHILRNTVLALLDFPGSTMLDIPRMLTNNRFREKVVESVKDPIIKEFWVNEFAQYDAKFKTEAVSPILNKVGQFLSSSTIRNIVGQPKSTINIREIMDQKKVMVVNLSRGKIGEDNSALLGAMMITKIQLAAMSRADVPVEERPDSYLYVDEFQNFATESFAVILAEARKYNLNLTMAHQYIAQLKDEVREAVFGNAGTLITFRVGGSDADVLVKEYAPVFEANDMVNLDKYHIYIKLLVDGISAPAFSARTLPPVSRLTGILEQVVQRSHEKYSRSRQSVEEMIADRSRQEEKELFAEAEAFRKGGLEALLVKKPAPASAQISQDETEETPPHKEVYDQTLANTAILAAPEEPRQIAEDNQILEPVGSSEAGESAPKKEEGPKIVKFQNIIGEKLYKERTARAGVKWYVGEEIDEEKLSKSGYVFNDSARTMMELAKKVAGNGGSISRQSDYKPEPVITTGLVADVHNEIADGEMLPVVQPVSLPAVQDEPLPAVESATLPVPEKTETTPTTQDIQSANHLQAHKHLEEGKPVKLSDPD